MKQIPLYGRNGVGKFALVDDEDYEFLMQWRWFGIFIKASNNIYIQRNVKVGDKWKTSTLHRLIVKAKPGDIVDHKDRDTFNNQKTNLRFCTKSENNANRRSASKKTTGYLGVFLRPDSKVYKWRAILRHKTIAYNLGHYKTPEEAAIAYNNKAIEVHGEFANLNVIPCQSYIPPHQ